MIFKFNLINIIGETLPKYEWFDENHPINLSPNDVMNYKYREFKKSTLNFEHPGETDLICRDTFGVELGFTLDKLFAEPTNARYGISLFRLFSHELEARFPGKIAISKGRIYYNPRLQP